MGFPSRATETRVERVRQVCQRQLNIVGPGAAGVLSLNGGEYGADMLVDLIGMDVMARYDRIRLVLCHSAGPVQGGDSLAQQLARLAGKPITGFRGKVCTMAPSMALLEELA
ncbi:hypothetical protein CR207_08765 [Chromobacterium violaceum]|nr:hypothetical protein CRN81_08745 [Chromobacterium violaceum]ATP32392.1 hypothetical protein CR207_08765 [Chromobacterium violaceum]